MEEEGRERGGNAISVRTTRKGWRRVAHLQLGHVRQIFDLLDERECFPEPLHGLLCLFAIRGCTAPGGFAKHGTSDLEHFGGQQQALWHG